MVLWNTVQSECKFCNYTKNCFSTSAQFHSNIHYQVYRHCLVMLHTIPSCSMKLITWKHQSHVAYLSSGWGELYPISLNVWGGTKMSQKGRHCNCLNIQITLLHEWDEALHVRYTPKNHFHNILCFAWQNQVATHGPNQHDHAQELVIPIYIKQHLTVENEYRQLEWGLF